MKPAIGIDLGTTFSLVALVDESERPRVVANRFDKPLTPSVIYFGSGEPLVGDEAKEMQALGEQQVACFFKRNMGDPNYALTFGDQIYTATDLSAILLKTLKAEAEFSLGRSISQAVITVPAYFNNFQREATIQAGQMAGLEVLSIVNEPTAAALAYGMHRQSGEQTLVVYDLGGGTFDITLVQVTPESIDVLATSGDHELGGKDWDDRIATYLAQRFKDDHGVDPLEDSMSFNDLLVRCENAKRQLSSRKSARVTISHSGEKVGYELTRQQFEQMTQDLMERTQNLTEEVLNDAELNWHRIDGVLLVGGSTRMPMVWEYVEQMCGRKPLAGVNVDQAVALGAAIQAYMDTAQAIGFTLPGVKRKQDIMSHSLGMVAENEDRSRYINSIIVPKNKPIPCEEKRPYQLRTAPGRENTIEVYMLQGESEQPLECVVLGKYVFSGITHVAGRPAEIEIGYAYDRNGVVKVEAVERPTTKSLKMSVEPVPEDMSWLELPPKDEEVIQVPISVFLSIDVSSSMEGEPIKEAKDAARAFIKNTDLKRIAVGIVAFESRASLICPLSHDTRRINKNIDKLKSSGSTDMTGGILTAYGELKHMENPRFMVLLTDGHPDDRSSAEMAGRKVCNDGIELITIGTRGADKKFLKKIACSDEGSFFAQSGQVVNTFSKIAQEIGRSHGGLKISESGKDSGILGKLKLFGKR